MISQSVPSFELEHGCEVRVSSKLEIACCSSMYPQFWLGWMIRQKMLLDGTTTPDLSQRNRPSLPFFNPIKISSLLAGAIALSPKTQIGIINIYLIH